MEVVHCYGVANVYFVIANANVYWLAEVIQKEKISEDAGSTSPSLSGWQFSSYSILRA